MGGNMAAYTVLNLRSIKSIIALCDPIILQLLLEHHFLSIGSFLVCLHLAHCFIIYDHPYDQDFLQN